MCDHLNPHVVIMDLVMEGMDGAEATSVIRKKCPEIQVIALTSYKDEELVQKAIQAGAIGYLLKNVSAHELAEAIRAAYKGRPTLAPEAAQVALENRLFWETVEVQPDGSVLVFLASPDLDWAASSVLMYGPLVEVLDPPELRQRIAEWAQAIAGVYALNDAK